LFSLGEIVEVVIGG